MWFKQVQLFRLMDAFRLPIEQVIEKLEPLAFTSCLPSMPFGMGWVSLVDEEGAPLARMVNGCIMLCLQIEEKILPASVIRQELMDKVKQIEALEGRKVYQKQKLSLRDEITMTLLPRAFSKLTRVYAYIDTRNQWLVLGSSNEKKTEQFLSLFKKSISENIFPYELNKLSPVTTHWLKKQNHPQALSIEKSCVLIDPDQQNRVVRCQQQDLFAEAIQALIKDGYEVKQLALCWHDLIRFVLVDNFSLQGIRFEDQVIAQSKEMEPETRQQQFDADFFMMTETLTGLLNELLQLFIKSEKSVKTEKSRVAETEMA
ncbi:MAG TPA: recombination-associated protein RdgC [Gammaproteobacteria bacterium]|nr:recombination-associated protein RdgC [Gammaproteobacteria bacterium]